MKLMIAFCASRTTATRPTATDNGRGEIVKSVYVRETDCRPIYVVSEVLTEAPLAN